MVRTIRFVGRDERAGFSNSARLFRRWKTTPRCENPTRKGSRKKVAHNISTSTPLASHISLKGSAFRTFLLHCFSSHLHKQVSRMAWVVRT